MQNRKALILNWLEKFQKIKKPLYTKGVKLR